MPDNEITHELIQPIKYTPKDSGEQMDASFVTMREPSVKQLTACSTLKQAFMRVIAAQQSDSQAPPSDDAPSDDAKMEDNIINALYASQEDISKIFVTAKDLFRNVAMIDGEKSMTVPMLDALCIADLEKMVGKYMANFILASVLEDQ